MRMWLRRKNRSARLTVSILRARPARTKHQNAPSWMATRSTEVRQKEEFLRQATPVDLEKGNRRRFRPATRNQRRLCTSLEVSTGAKRPGLQHSARRDRDGPIIAEEQAPRTPCQEALTEYLLQSGAETYGQRMGSPPRAGCHGHRLPTHQIAEKVRDEQGGVVGLPAFHRPASMNLDACCRKIMPTENCVERRLTPRYVGNARHPPGRPILSAPPARRLHTQILDSVRTLLELR